MIRSVLQSVFALGFLTLALLAPAQEMPRRAAPIRSPEPPPAQPELIDVRTIDPTILVDLRYASPRNITGRPLYPTNMPALVRPNVAEKLARAQDELVPRGYRLKIWDAWRPKAAHDELWRLFPNKDFVGNPNDGIGSLHTWGVAVDATMTDANGHEVTMPTDFDVFTPAAMLKYTGKDPFIAMHLHTLQRAMAHADFFGMRTEWWHFVSRGWTGSKPINEVQLVAQQPVVAPPPTIPPRQASSGGSSGGSR